MKLNKGVLFIIFLLIILNAFVYGHPHLFIENAFTFVFNERGLNGIKVKWIFDEIYSASLIMDFDGNRDKTFEEKEKKALEADAFSNLKSYHYFLSININKKKYQITEVRDFNAEIADNKVNYYFFLPLNIPATATQQVLTAGCYDDSYFCFITYSKSAPVVPEDDAHYICEWEIIEDKKNAYWAGSIIPRLVEFKFRKKNE